MDVQGFLFLYLSVGISDIEMGSHLSVYVNQSSKLISIRTSVELRNSSLFLFDIFGRVVKKINRLEQENTIEIYELTSGIYIFVVDDDRTKITKRIFISD